MHVVLYGQKEVPTKFTGSNFSAQDVIEMWVAAHLYLHQENPAFEYFLDFLKYALLDIPLPVSTRYPKRGLMNFINDQYALL